MKAEERAKRKSAVQLPTGCLCRFCHQPLKQGPDSPHIHDSFPGVPGKYIYCPSRVFSLYKAQGMGKEMTWGEFKLSDLYEHSLAYLQCDEGQVISVYGADYGRCDQSTCTYKRPASEIQKTDCSRPASTVSDRYSCLCQLVLHVESCQNHGIFNFITAVQLQCTFKPVFTYMSPCLHSCDGKNSCIIKASNSVFGDPVPGTFKYLEVAYVCVCK
uniref:SUEL-type lectin domain-containing protein n=1 Tax=Sander lucioperca TaxID=283035 RepID=A0A8C9X7F1_SANLU